MCSHTLRVPQVVTEVQCAQATEDYKRRTDKQQRAPLSSGPSPRQGAGKAHTHTHTHTHTPDYCLPCARPGLRVYRAARVHEGLRVCTASVPGREGGTVTAHSAFGAHRGRGCLGMWGSRLVRAIHTPCMEHARWQSTDRPRGCSCHRSRRASACRTSPRRSSME